LYGKTEVKQGIINCILTGKFLLRLGQVSGIGFYKEFQEGYGYKGMDEWRKGGPIGACKRISYAKG
tara:strand:- start:490 stop:687 length:198 start_codon:yes stop_codon:yes gene_type:complete